ncbi:MAG: biotin transporter BioY [Pseudomonadota bacterium]
MTPTAMALGPMTPIRQVALVLGGTLLLAAASQVSVPFFPVPMTMQTLAVMLVGFAYGSRLGAITVLAWLGQAALGAPVLANFANGAAFVGPTAGFLLGFVGMAWLTGRAADRGVASPLKLAGVALAASALLYVPGLAWPLGVAQAAGIEAGWAGLSFGQVLSGFALPFLLGDAVKAILAALIVSGAVKALHARA